MTCNGGGIGRLQMENLTAVPADVGRYEIKLVLKPSVPCGASAAPESRQPTHALRGMKHCMPCGAPPTPALRGNVRRMTNE